ncbi:hypothetical protein FA95DRAFT_1560802 [Auriscalpium vulgare]|uniref:Uncharacterized protein n=1 Tax=Auriscalpium vulgare TaxID=40419 RepID=A0ACB8RNZ5_9AGAM|nr:hypothetical protein FA95DRAFT_1560802 [Auriscalpium vulgare]
MTAKARRHCSMLSKEPFAVLLIEVIFLLPLSTIPLPPSMLLSLSIMQDHCMRLLDGGVVHEKTHGVLVKLFAGDGRERPLDWLLPRRSSRRFEHKAKEKRGLSAEMYTTTMGSADIVITSLVPSHRRQHSSQTFIRTTLAIPLIPCNRA